MHSSLTQLGRKFYTQCVFFVIFIAFAIPQAASAQYYSGNVGDYITLPQPTLTGGYEIYACSFLTNSSHLYVASGTSRVKIVSYFTGYETVQCDYHCVRQYTVAGKVYQDYQNGTAYYFISCSSNPNPNPDPNPDPNPSLNPYDYVIDYGCWGTISISEGETKTVYCQYEIPNPSNVKSIAWTDYSSYGYDIISQNQSACTIKGGFSCSNQKLWCLMKYGNTSYRAYYLVNVKPVVAPTGITVSPSSMNIGIGDTKTLSYSLTPTDASTTVRWESDNTSIATVGKYSGEVKGVGVGTTYIWAITANGKKDCCIVTVEEPPFIGVKYAIAGYDHSLVIKEDGSLWACGNNENGQLCNGKTSEIHSFTKIMNGVSNAAAGNGNSRIIKDDGSLWACGTNTFGQLGDGTTTRRYLKKVMDNVAYVTGTFQSLIIKKDATLWVCGNNLFGILGNGTTEGIISPVKIMNDVASVNSENLSHSLIVKKDGSLWACGYNNYGQLGDGTTTDRTTPVKIMENVSTVAAGGGHSLIVKKDGTLWACGRNDYGQLGDGTTTNRGSFKKIMDNVASVEATSRYSFIIKTDGSLWACGDNDYGQLGAGFASMYSTPVKIMDDVRSVSTLQVYTLIVKKDGSLWACGTNKYGQLGDGSTTSRYTPVEIMEGNIESGINDFRYEKEVFNNSSTTKIYSITGQRISYPKKGINIINGKKVVVK